ncbi:hypothetical protein OOK60_09055 [Trichothermofontia sichuanensis B231]|uniref:hypothetical protein n=1 Tax=Trichothermofontia sichuanensis TaxID=3045816 RepID=UPI0022461845|nr:hypothetical protein [Trichothermofontia sichuanensis]UZQ56179.1 hypothetical protein OOK60_09055 [Trichothermofontia sichuanensis B231]
MTHVYTTEELITILDRERQACLTGQRLNLTVAVSGNPLIDRLVRPDGVQKFAAYCDFRAMIHAYQQEQGVSGIIWRELTLKGYTLRYPQIHDQLIALPSDLNLLKLARSSILHFWTQVTADMDCYLSLNNGKDFQAIAPQEIAGIVDRTEWASLTPYQGPDFLELILQLGWGQPDAADYKRGWPTAGSEQIHAVQAGRQPIC